MHDEGWSRIHAWKSLIHDGVSRGTDLVERHHRRTADKPFEVLGSFEYLAGPTRIVRTLHDGVFSLTYWSIRTVHHGIEAADDWITKRLAPTQADEKGESGKNH